MTEPPKHKDNNNSKDDQPKRKLLTAPEVAQRLNVGRSTAFDLMRKGEIRSVRIGKKSIRAIEDDLDDYIDRRTIDSNR